MAEIPGPRPDGAGLLQIACQEFVELVTDYLEGALPRDLEGAVRAHLALCEPCEEYLDQMRRTASALHTLPAPTLPPALRAEVLEVFAQLRPHRRHGDPGG